MIIELTTSGSSSKFVSVKIKQSNAMTVVNKAATLHAAIQK